jgi:orotidine-5'-phosphate decarboxylase
MFSQRLAEHADAQQTYLCVGLDPDLRQLPTSLQTDADPIYTFCATIIEATVDLVCAFKPNSAFFEALGPHGFETLRRVIIAVQRRVPVILDAKRGDIGNTAQAYAHAAFEYLHADAITASPYLGGDSLTPFLRNPDRGCFLLCKTSNPGSHDLQNLQLANHRPLYLEVAHIAQTRWNTANNLGLVVGATHPHELATVRTLCPDLPLLIPGIGAQGGDLRSAVLNGLDAQHGGIVINASRSVLYASAGHDFAAAARHEAQRLRDTIREIIRTHQAGSGAASQ